MDGRGFRGVLVVFVFAAAVWASFGCAVAAETIKIGVAAPFTGDTAGFGDNVKDGVLLRVEEINNAGGIGGREIEVLFEDDVCAPKEAGAVGAKFANNREVVAVIGHLCSSATLAALPIYVRKKLPCISATSTNATIGRLGKGWFFRNCYTDDFQSRFLASYVRVVLGLSRVGIFYEQNDYAIGLKDSFVHAADELDMKIVGTEAYTKSTTDFGPQLTKLKSGRPDGIFVSGYYQQGALIVRQARQAGLSAILFGADGLDNADFIKLAGDAAGGTYMSVPFLAEAAGPEGERFAERFKERAHRDPDWMSANAYDCMGILAEVIAKVGPDRKNIRAGLASYNSRDKAFKGVTGATFFDRYGDCQKPAFVKTVRDGRFVPARQLP